MWLRLAAVVMVAAPSVVYGALAGEWHTDRSQPPDGRRSIQLMRSAGMPPDDWQIDVLLQRAPRLLLNITRQGGKSTVCAGLAVDTALKEAGSLSLLVSRAQRQAGELLRKVRALLYAMDEPPRFKYESTMQLELASGSRIIALPGVEATVRSYSGANLVVFDEMARIDDDLYHAMRPMIAVSDGMLVGASTPFGKRGCFWEEWENGTEWKKVMVQAPDMPRITPEFLAEELKRGQKWFNQEYMCSFEDMEGAAFTAEEIKAIFDDAVEMYS